MTDLVALPVLLPLLAAGAKLALGPRRPFLQRSISVGTLVAVLVIAVLLLVRADRHGPQVLTLAGWPAPLGITLVADRLAALMLAVSAAVTLGVLGYSLGQGAAEEEEELPLSVFHPTFLVLVAGVADAFLAGDLFNLYVGFEILLVASYVLITLGGTEARVRAGTTYVVVNVLSSVILLSAVGLVYAATGTVNMAQIAVRLDELGRGGSDPRLMLEGLLLVAFAIKAAIFPLSAWLPDSYPTAPAPVTAVFAGLLTKVGIYAIIRTETLLFPTQEATRVLLVLALLTMIVGILGAVAQTDVKRLLSFTLVSHIGYMVFGIGLGTTLGLAGAVFYVVHHITVQTTLFLVVGLIELRAGSTSTSRIGGLAKTTPLLSVLFFLPAMNLAGIPPFSGFLGKLGLLEAGVQVGSPAAWALVVGSVATSLLTLYAIGKAWARVFWRTPRVGIGPGDRRGRRPAEEDAASEAGTHEITTAHGAIAVVGDAGSAGRTDEVPDPPAPAIVGGGPGSPGPPRLMLASTVSLVVLGLAYTVFAGPLFGLSARTATELRDRPAYVAAVLPPGVR